MPTQILTVGDGRQRAHQGCLARLVGLGLAALALVLAGCGASATTASSPTPTPTVTVAPSPTATPIGYPVLVYFSKYPESDNNNSLTSPVKRVSPTSHVEVFAIQLLLAGPTPEERAAGYFTELNSILNGPSMCSAAPAPTGGPDFTLTLDHKGTAPEQGTATLRFCRTTLSPGEGADARNLAQINATLLQFSTIKKVVVLTLAGHCYGDLSGMDRCLQ
jgi:hypothetical protein